MAGISGWYGTAYECAADPSKSHGVGWYQDGKLLASTYKNPATGVAYTSKELQVLAGGGATGTPTGTTTTPVAGTTTATSPVPSYTAPTLIEGTGPGGLTYQQYLAQAPEGTPEATVQAHWLAIVNAPQTGHPITPGAGTTMPTFGAGAGAGIPTPTITPAPAYEISPAQTAFEEMLGGKITDWVESGGYGIPEETQALMIQKQTDSLKARETESIRVMRNNMERRGITNSGFVFANEQAIRSNTTVAIAGAIADVQINSALMKMASFEKAMGAAGQFLGYLSEQSQLKYAPQFATWQAEQMAKMQVWQGKLDVYKMELNQAYQTQNMILQGQITSQLNQEQNAFNLQLAEMELEANQQAAQAQGIGSLFGTILGFLFGK